MTKEQELAVKVATLTEKAHGMGARLKKLEDNQRWVVLAIGSVVLKLISEFVTRV